VEDRPLQIGEIVKVVVFTHDEMIFYRAGGDAYRTHHLVHGGTLREGVIALFPTMCSVRQWESTSHNVSLASGQHKWGWQEGTYLVK